MSHYISLNNYSQNQCTKNKYIILNAIHVYGIFYSEFYFKGRLA